MKEKHPMQNRIWIDGYFPDGEEAQITIEDYPEKGKLLLSGHALSRPVVLSIEAVDIAVKQASDVDEYNKKRGYYDNRLDKLPGEGDGDG